MLGKVRKFERHSSFGVGVITILPEGGFENPPSLNRVKEKGKGMWFDSQQPFVGRNVA